MIKKNLILLILILISFSHLHSQGEPDYREMFLEAESFFLFEEYNEALPLYLRLSNKYPENDNINYKIGVCYLNNIYEKEKSISYLERAVTDINPKYKDNNFKETSAPLESLFALGNAYRINNQLDKAIETYQQFKQQADPAIYDHDLIEEQIIACNNALDMKTRPVDLDLINLGDRINTRFADINPVLSGDETKMVYIQQQQFYDAVFYSEKVDGEWSYPRNIIPELGVDEDAYPTALSYDGTILLIYRSDNFIGDLYYSEFSNGSWSTLIKLNDNINTKYWESHACLTKNSDTLYFTSNRKGGYGGLDIYYSVKDPSGEWGTAVNLGPVINSKYNEETPFITADGKTLYFSSYGHYNMGGYDIFYSNRLDENTWSAPMNAGYPINTTEDDIFFHPVQNGNFAYFPRFLEGSLGFADIYIIEIFSTTHPRKFRIKGLVSYPPEAIMTRPVSVKVIEEFSRDTVTTAFADLPTGEFSFEITAGSYDLLIEGEEIETMTIPLHIPEGSKDKEIQLESGILLTLTEKIVDKTELTDTLIYVAVDEEVVKEQVVSPPPPPPPAPIPSDIEKYYQELEMFHKELYENADGELKTFLEQIDLKKNDLATETDLIEYLKENADAQGYTVQDVYDLIIEKIQSQYIQSYIDELAGLCENDALKNTLLNMDPGKENISGLQELYEYLVNNATSGGYEIRDVNYLFSLLSQREELFSILDKLTEISTGGINQALLDLDPDKEKLKNPIDLMNYLLSNSARYDYSEADALKLLFEYLQKEDLSEIMKILIGTASGPLQELLIKLNLESEGIKNIADLYNYLLAQAKYNNYSESDVINLFLNLLNVLEKKDIIKKVELPQAAPVTAEKRSLLLYYIIGAGLIIILLILIFFRRKDKKKTE